MQQQYLELHRHNLTSSVSFSPFYSSSGASLGLEGFNEILDSILRVVGKRGNEGDSLGVVVGVKVPHHDSFYLRYLALVDVLTIKMINAW